MIEFISDVPFSNVGWIGLQFLWISTVLLGTVFLVVKILKPFHSGISYKIEVGALFTLPLIPFLLGMKHYGILPPLGFADWAPSIEGEAAREPLIRGLPQITGIELGSLGPPLYYWLGVTWVITACLLIGYQLIAVLKIMSDCRQRAPLKDPKLIHILTDIADTLNIPTDFKICKAGIKEGPSVTGFFRTYLLLPPSLTNNYTDSEIRALLIHELIHVKRKDYLIAFFQRIIHSIFFPQPLLWRLNTIIHRDREHICDQVVTKVTQNSHEYGNTLVKLYLQTQSPTAHALHISNNSMVTRIKRLVNRPQDPLTRYQRFGRASVATLIMVVGLFCTFWNAYHLHPETQDHEISTHAPASETTQITAGHSGS